MGINNAPALAAAAISRRSVSVAMNALHLRAPARPGKRRSEAADEQHLRESVMKMNNSGGHAGHMSDTCDRAPMVTSGWRPEERRVGEAGVRAFRSRRFPDHYKKTMNLIQMMKIC